MKILILSSFLLSTSLFANSQINPEVRIASAVHRGDKCTITTISDFIIPAGKFVGTSILGSTRIFVSGGVTEYNRRIKAGRVFEIKKLSRFDDFRNRGIFSLQDTDELSVKDLSMTLETPDLSIQTINDRGEIDINCTVNSRESVDI